MNYFEVVKLHSNAKLPKKGSEFSSGLDLYAANFKMLFNSLGEKITKEFIRELREIELAPLERVLIGTGLATNFPIDMEMQIRSRSGLALKEGLMVSNGVGTIDADYKDEIGVILTNVSPSPVKINIGDRIAQAIFIKVERLEPKWADTLVGSDREGGFGHTGKD